MVICIAMQRQGKQRSSSGPALPSKLSKEIGANNSEAGPRNERVSKAFALADRKAQRKAKRQKKGQQRLRFTQKLPQDSSSPRPLGKASRKRQPETRQEASKPHVKRAKTNVHSPAKDKPHVTSTIKQSIVKQSTAQRPRKPGRKESKFDELVQGDSLQGDGQHSIAAELAFQKQLAKQLGLKGSSKAKPKGPDDGLDDLLEGISAAKDVPQQKPHLSRAAGRTPATAQALDSDDALESDEPSDSDQVSHSDKGSDSEMLDSDSEGEVCDTDSDGAADQTLGDIEAAAANHRSLEERRAGMPAETRGQPAVTPVEVSNQRYLPPAARAAASAQMAAGQMSQLQRRVRGLLNRMSDSNLPGIVADVLQLAELEGERAIAETITAELLQAAAEGPRASERFAAVVAAFISGLTGTSDAAGIGANFTSALAARLEDASLQDQSLACANLATVLAHLYTCSLLPATTIYSFLDHLTHRFAEGDVAMMLTLLQSCGHQLRSDDSISMKDFVVAVHARAAKAGAEGLMSKRADIMLSLVLDIKNNKRRDKASGPAAVLSPSVVAWLKQCHVGHVQLKGLTWQKLLSPNKKGLWWLPSVADADKLQPLKGGLAMAAVEAEQGPGGSELLKLAAAQRMSTDARRAAFCVVMGSEDYIDASDRLLRLPLKGEAEREVVRVTVECCLQERSWNPYYVHLLQRLLAASKAHRVTLQYCLWDQFKQAEQADMRRLINLAHLTGQLIATFTLSSSILKIVEFSTTMTAKSTLLWRVMFRHLLAVCKDVDAVEAVFSRITGQDQLLEFRAALLTFLRLVVGPWLADESRTDSTLNSIALQRLRVAELALKSSG